MPASQPAAQAAPPSSGRPHTWTMPVRRGFSLLELSLVIAIIGALMAVAAVNIIGGADRAKTKATVISMEQIDAANTDYRLANNSFAPDLQTLVEQQYLQSLPMDGWDKPFYYTLVGEGSAYKLISLGPDGTPNTEDDLDADFEIEK